MWLRQKKALLDQEMEASEKLDLSQLEEYVKNSNQTLEKIGKVFRVSNALFAKG